MSSSLPESDAVAGKLDEVQARSAETPLPDKQTDDPRLLPTTDEPPPVVARSHSPVVAQSPDRATEEQPTRVVGEDEVLERLGRGGMGEVYKARHRRLNKLVALKLLPAELRYPRESVARFQREMEAVGALDHPNVVEAHDAGEQSGVVYLAMKLIDGVDLERLVRKGGPLPITEACGLVRQAALGLHYLHQRGLVHRDVKPSNLMRTPDGTVKVPDLGLARCCLEPEEGSSLTGMWRVMGTPDFLAPEQVDNAADADARADLYGLGGTLFYLLTGRAPFADHKSPFSKFEAHRLEPPPDVQRFRPDVPAELAALLHRLLAKQPQDRFPTAAETAAALAPFAGALSPPDSSSLPPLPTTILEAKPRKARWPWLAGAGGGLTLALICFVFASNLRQDLPPTPLHIAKLDIRLTRNVNEHGLPAGLIGTDAFDPHEGDTVTVQAQLSHPAYAFLIAFQPDGKAEVCFPEEEDERPTFTVNPRYPSRPESAAKEFGLTDGTGLQAFAVVVSRRSLPPFGEWWSHCGVCPWKSEQAAQGVVYRANGEDAVEAWNAAGRTRGKAVEDKDKKPLADLAIWLRDQPGVETVQVFGFVVGPKKKD